MENCTLNLQFVVFILATCYALNNSLSIFCSPHLANNLCIDVDVHFLSRNKFFVLPIFEQVWMQAGNVQSIPTNKYFPYLNISNPHNQYNLPALIHCCIVVVFFSYAIVYEKGYQRKEDVVSSVTIKVQGIDYTNGTGNFTNVGDRVWDTADYVIPPQVSLCAVSLYIELCVYIVFCVCRCAT